MDRVNRNRNAFPGVKHLHKYIRQWVWIGIVRSTVHDFWCFFFFLPVRASAVSTQCSQAVLTIVLWAQPPSLQSGWCVLPTYTNRVDFIFFPALLILSFPPTCISRRAGDLDQGIRLIQFLLNERQCFSFSLYF